MAGEYITQDNRNWLQKLSDSIMNSSTVQQYEFARDQVTNNPPDYSKQTIIQPNASTGGASGSWGTPAPTPTIKTPVYSKTPAPQPAATPTGDGFSMAYYPGWDETAAKADWAATKGAKANQGGGGTQNLNGEIDAIYNPLNAALQNYMSELERQRPVAIEEATNLSNATGNELDRSLTQYGADRDAAKQGLQGTYESAYSQAVREANALKQGAQTRFGGGSSTGGAVSELIGQEFLRGAGDLRQTLMQGIQQVFTAYNNASRFVGDKKAELKTALGTETKKINLLYDQKRADIEAQQYQNESAKQAARVDILREQMANTQALVAQKNQAELQLSVWEEQLKQTLAADLAENAAATLKTTSGIPNFNQPSFSTPGGGTTGGNTIVPTAPRVTLGSDYNSKALADTSLQSTTFENLYNPFGV